MTGCKCGLVDSFQSALGRVIDSKNAKYYLNRSGYEVVGYLGRFYTEDEYTIIEETKTTKRQLNSKGRILFYSEDNAYDPKKNPDGVKYKVIGHEMNGDKKMVILEYKAKVRSFTHRIGDAYKETNQLFIKVPIIRFMHRGKYITMPTNDIIKVKNITSRITLDELVSFISCDVDKNDEKRSEAPYYTLNITKTYPSSFIDLCNYLNERVGMQIDTSTYKEYVR
jgi:hypothetical protein